MGVKPEAELVVGEPLVRELLAAQHPDLADRSLRPLANGWDNVLYRLGDDLVVRLPRRHAAAALIEHEAAWLPRLEGLVPVPIPVPLRTGRPTARFPWTWTIVPWFEGTSALRLGVRDRSWLAEPLGTALARLHRAAPADAPRNPMRGVPLSERNDSVRRWLADRTADTDAIAALWEELSDAPPWVGPPVWLHGDPHPGNVLVDGGRLSAIIDFGDVCAGDPATDLAASWLFFDAEARAEFREAVERIHPHSADDWRRARGWALLLGLAISVHSDDDDAMAALGAHTVAQAIAG